MRLNQPRQNLREVLGIWLITLASISACNGERAVEQQSPVDIAGYTTGGKLDVSFAYSGHAKSLINTGEFVKVIYEDAGASCWMETHTS